MGKIFVLHFEYDGPRNNSSLLSPFYNSADGFSITIGKKTPKEVSEALEVNKRTIQNIKEKYLESGIDNALYDKPRPGAPTLFNGKARAKITSLACTKAPEGYAKWSLRLLAEKAAELDIVDDISHNHVGIILKKTKQNHILKDNGAYQNRAYASK